VSERNARLSAALGFPLCSGYFHFHYQTSTLYLTHFALALYKCTSLRFASLRFASLEAMPEPNKSTARAAFENNGFSVLCKDLDEAVKVSDSIAPEVSERVKRAEL